jgi:hypothetical protein
MAALRAELAAIRDSMFADILKGIPEWHVPALVVAAASHSLLGAAIGMLSAAASAAWTAGVTRKNAERAAKRKNGMAYLVELAEELKPT